LGDIYVGYDQATRQAEEAGVPLPEELARLAIHGTLHVLGHDHPEGPERLESAMFRLQEQLVRRVMEDAGEDR
jgi:probable rRNA maturation factor